VTRASVTLPPPPDPVWEAGEPPEAGAVQLLARELSLPPALCSVLVGRGMADPGAVRAFLRPRLEHLHPPAALPDADRAADRILRAIDDGETILVHGDYDVDGVCAAALLTRWLRRLGGNVVPFVPHRTEHGYDLGPAGVAAAVAAGARLLLTCDSGIVAHAAVDEATAQGIDVIVTDHHVPGATLPAAVAVVNPLRHDSTYPESTLCGTGVAYKLAELLAERRGIDKSELHPFLALVALATVADLVPLEGENRVLVRFGLRFLAHTKDPGLRALMEVAGVQGDVDAGQVGFVLGPRINAIGRMGAADTAMRLLLAEDRTEALALARELDEANRVRQDEDRRTLDQALEQLARSFDPARDFGVVLAGEGWHPGVIGIVASRIVERIHRPAVVIALDGDRGRGSARSIPGVHLHEALQGCAGHLERFGGHRQAAGMDVAASGIDAFREAFNGQVRAQLSGNSPVPRLGCGTSLSLEQADDDLHRLLEYMAPFGIGNPRPVFQVRGVEIAGVPREVGDGHLKLTLREGTGQLDGIGFGLARRRPPEALRGARVDAVFQLRMHEYRGRSSLQARLMDLRPAASGAAGTGDSLRGEGQVA
jgi:single-stranded-DNA-specific exonuclease